MSVAVQHDTSAPLISLRPTHPGERPGEGQNESPAPGWQPRSRRPGAARDSAWYEPCRHRCRASTGAPVWKSAPALPPDTNGDVGPNHYVESSTPTSRSSTRPAPPLRPGRRQHALERLRRRLPDQQRRRPDRRYDQLADRWMFNQFAVDDDAVPPVRGRLDRPAIRPARTSGTRSRTRLPRLPEARRLAGRLLHHLQHVQRSGRRSPAGGLRLRPDADARRPPATQQCFTLASMAGSSRPTSTGDPPPAGSPNYLMTLAARRPACTSGSSTSTGRPGNSHAHRARRTSTVAASRRPAAAAPASRSRARRSSSTRWPTG